MGMGFLILTASVASVPTMPTAIGDAAHWLVAADLVRIDPSKATVTSFDLALDAAGHPMACTITSPSGSPEIDRLVCAALLKHAKYRPARDAEGNPLPSVVRDRVNWIPNGLGPNRYTVWKPDIILTNPKTSANLRDPVIQTALVISAEGRVETCSAKDRRDREDLKKAACDLASSSYFAKVVTDETGHPVRGVRGFNVGFMHAETAEILVR